MKIRDKVWGAVVALTATATIGRAQTLDVPSYLEVRDVPHGTVQQLSYTSRALGTDREVVVYTPPDYNETAQRYPVSCTCFTVPAAIRAAGPNAVGPM